MDVARPLNEATEAKATDEVRYEMTRNAKMLRALSIAACKAALEYAARRGIELFNWAAIDAFADLLWSAGRVPKIEEDAKGCWSAALALLHEHEDEIVATQRTLRTVGRVKGVVTFTHFTCQPRCALKDRKEENQAVRGLDVGANSTENGLFLASVMVWTTPARHLAQ
jgi:hypothetical protein